MAPPYPPPPFEPWVRETLSKLVENVSDIHTKVILHDVDLPRIKARLAYLESRPPRGGTPDGFDLSDSGLHAIDSRSGKIMTREDARKLWAEEELKAAGRKYQAWWKFGSSTTKEILALVLAGLIIALLGAHLGMSIPKP